MYRKEGNDYLEYRIIPAREEVVRRLSAEEFTQLEAGLRDAVAQDAKKLGESIIAGSQKRLDEITAAKAEIEKPTE